MTQTNQEPLLAIINPGPGIDPALARAARDNGFRVILDGWGLELSQAVRELGAAGSGDLHLTLDRVTESDFQDAVSHPAVQTLWLDCHPLWVDRPQSLEQSLGEIADRVEVIPILTTPESIAALVRPGCRFRRIALKGAEGAGPVGLEPASLLFAQFRAQAAKLENPPQAVIHGGAVRPEAVAAYLACGAGGVVFESLGLGLDLEGIDPAFFRSLASLEPEQTRIVGREAGFPLRIFDRGISKAAAGLDRDLAALGGPGSPPPARAARGLLSPEMNRPWQGLSPDRVVFLGPEASFCAAFGDRFGTEPGPALGRFRAEVKRLWRESPRTWGRFLESPLRREFGLDYPFVQGAMAWISDRPGFARAVKEAGGLPTLSLGLRNRDQLEADLAGLTEELGGAAFAVNLLALPENKNLEDQLAWIRETRPGLVVVAGFTAPLVRRIKSLGLRTACLAVDRAGMVAALEAGADFLILEGNEAGGHVGPLSTQTLAQVALDLDDSRPDLDVRSRIILAGGVFDRETLFRAAIMGARGVQMGTAYLATQEIVSSGALSPLYQRLILESGFGSTVLTGQSLGLSVRALNTARIRELRELEQEIRSTGMEESQARARIEEKVLGSLHIAARSRREPGGPVLDPETCRCQGQFLSGAGAGGLGRVQTLAQLHRDLAAGPFEPVLPQEEAASPARSRTVTRPGPERIAITGMAISNSLGNSPEEFWEATAAMRSGVSEVPLSKWDHQALFDPDPRAPGKTYCRFGAFQELEISRRELGLPPQDFRTMSGSTRLTLWLADRALKDSGLLESGYAPDRIGVVVAQNSGEAPDRLREVFLHLEAGRIVEEIGRVAGPSPAQAREMRGRLRELGLAIDDTTLLGRLNCAAGGFISNKYGLRGPCHAVTAACAGSLAALYSAVLMIRAGVIDAALVGGGEEPLGPAHFLEFSALGALAGFSGAQRSPSGASRPLDLRRDGMVLGEGGAMIVIERESLARGRKAGIKALITSVGASNNDQGMVESSASTQRLALGAALEGLDRPPEELGLIECHATGTVQGDVQEVTALKSVLPRQARGPVLAALKSQIGHTLGASGLGGVIRAALAMGRGVLPGSLNYEHPDPEIGLEEWGFQVLDGPGQWPRQGGFPRRAMVNAFGFGGANYVVTLEEERGGSAPDPVRPSRPGPGPDDEPLPGLWLFRAGSGPNRVRIAALAEDEEQAGRMVRAAGENLLDLAPAEKASLAREGLFSGPAGSEPGPIALVLAGQGTYYQGMGRELYRNVPPIRRTLDRIASLAEYDLLDLLFQAGEERLRQTRWQQPALFALEYALGRYVLDLGIRPKALAGHSLGELTALCLSGVYDLEQGFALVEKRAQCMARASERMEDPGAMLALDPKAPGAERIISSVPGIFRSNHNSPFQTVLGGSTEAIQELKQRLAGENIRAVRLRVSMAFHSPLMKIIREDMAEILSKMDLNPPRIPVLSNTLGRPYPDDPKRIRRIILDHEESPVLWLADMEYLGQEMGIQKFLEIGPRDTLSGFIKDTLEEAECFQVCRPGRELKTLQTTLARLFCLGFWRPRGEILRVASPAKPATRPTGKNLCADPLTQLIQDRINRFLLDKFGHKLKPGIVAQARADLDPDFSEQDLEAHLRGEIATGEHLVGVPVPAPEQIETIQLAESLARSHRLARDRVGDPAKDGDRDILEQVIRIIMDATGYERDEIEPDMDLRQNLAIRSSRLPVIIDAVERTFGITVEWDDFLDVRTVRDLARKVAGMAGQCSPSRPGPKLAPEPDLRSPGTEKAADLEEDRARPDLDPPARLVVRRTRVEGLERRSLDLDPGGKVIVLARAGEKESKALTEQIGEALGLRTVPVRIDDPRYDLADPQGAARAGQAVAEAKDAVGLIMIPGREIPGPGQRTPDLLRGWFQVLREFLARPDKRFCLALENGPGSSPVGEGILGMFLTGALEYRSVLFRSLVLEPGWRPDPALVLSRSGPVPLFPGSQGIFAERLEQGVAGLGPKTPLPLQPGEVVVVSGGGRGITGRLAQALAPYGPRLVLLGRTAPDDPAREKELAQIVTGLEKAGLEAVYHPCDVTSAQQVEELLGRIHREQGPIAGIIHGAGRLRDAFARFLSPEDFDRVVRVKLAGAANLLASSQERGLRFALGFSSLVAVQGNPGQMAYTCANRALAALLREFGRAHPGVATKTLLLPPISGAGMADDPETRQLMEFKGLGRVYADLEEMQGLLARELLGAGLDEPLVGWARELPPVETALADLSRPQPLDGSLDCAGVRFPAERMPLIRSLERLDPGKGALLAGAVLSAAQDLWLEDHKPFTFVEKPLFSGIMAGETFLEAAGLIHPGLKPREIREIEYREALECPPDRVQGIVIRGRSGPLTSAGALVRVEIGRAGQTAGDREINFSGLVVLGPVSGGDGPEPGFNLIRPEELDTETVPPPEIEVLYRDQSNFGPRYKVIERILGTGPGLIQGRMYYPRIRDFPGPGETAYRYPVYLLEGLTQLMGFQPFLRGEVDRVDMMPLGIRSLTLIRDCRPGQQLDLQARVRRSSGPVRTWDGLGLDQEGRIILAVRGLTLARYGS